MKYIVANPSTAKPAEYDTPEAMCLAIGIMPPDQYTTREATPEEIKEHGKESTR